MSLEKIFSFLLFHYAVVVLSIDNQVEKGHHSLLHHYQKSLESDKAALLAFKMSITFDPQSALETWQGDSHVCNFARVKCDRRHHRVSQLRLNGTGIGGLLSPFIGNLTGLRYVDISLNHLTGPIPTEFSSLHFLRYLRLEGNFFHGGIPESFSFLPNLWYINLGNNNLTGIIPGAIFSNCTKLWYTDFSRNSFTGHIPAEVGKPPELWALNLFENNLTGKIPVSLSNSSTLYSLDVEGNHLSGELPVEVFIKLTSICFLHLSDNDMVSHDDNTNLTPFFESLTNSTNLREIELSGMGLGGSLPDSVGLLSVTVSTIRLDDNHIFGSVPPNVGNLTNLTVLNLSSNLLNGTIPPELGLLKNLVQLFLSNNSFTGPIPPTLGEVCSKGLLDISNNRLTGGIPDTLGDLNYLFLNNNFLSGPIPPSLGKCRDLHKLDLSYDKLTGRIPEEISGLSEIRIFLNLSHNLLEGPMPYEICRFVSEFQPTQEVFYFVGHKES